MRHDGGRMAKDWKGGNGSFDWELQILSKEI
jgi:hypothetical protein